MAVALSLPTNNPFVHFCPDQVNDMGERWVEMAAKSVVN